MELARLRARGRARPVCALRRREWLRCHAAERRVAHRSPVPGRRRLHGRGRRGAGPAHELNQSLDGMPGVRCLLQPPTVFLGLLTGGEMLPRVDLRVTPFELLPPARGRVGRSVLDRLAQGKGGKCIV
jgi:hypothetical protein